MQLLRTSLLALWSSDFAHTFAVFAVAFVLEGSPLVRSATWIVETPP